MNNKLLLRGNNARNRCKTIDRPLILKFTLWTIIAFMSGFACSQASRQDVIGRDVKCIMSAVRDSDYQSFYRCIKNIENFQSHEIEHFDFLKLVYFYRHDHMPIDSIHYQIVPPNKYDRLDDYLNVDVVLYDKHGAIDSSTGALYGAMHLGYDTTGSAMKLKRFNIYDKYDRSYSDYLFQHGKLKDFYPGLDTLLK